MDQKNTFFHQLPSGDHIATDHGVLPMSLFPGMFVSIHGCGTFKVATWHWHYGHEDPGTGLHIYLYPHSEMPVQVAELMHNVPPEQQRDP